jgi:hypothetical protein
VRHVLLAVSLLAALSSVPLASQSQRENRFLPDSPGVWKPWAFYDSSDYRRVSGARPADVKELEAQLLRLNAIIKKTPGIANPIGFSVETAGTLGLSNSRFSAAEGEPALTARPLVASMGLGPHPVVEYYGGGAPTQRVDTGEVEHLYFSFNDLAQAMYSGSDVPEFEKLDVEVRRLPAAQPDVFGFPRFGNSLVLKKSDAPIWVAVTFGETLDLVARGIDQRLTEQRDTVARVQKAYDDAKDPKKREERLAQYRKIAPQVKDPAYMDKMTKAEDQIALRADKEFLPQLTIVKEQVTKSEQELAGARTIAAGLSAADKAAPACYAANDKVSISRFRRSPFPGCEPLVRGNWKLFNPALPRSAVQLLTIGGFDRCLVPGRKNSHVGGCTAMMRLLESIDKTALMALVQ